MQSIKNREEISTEKMNERISLLKEMFNLFTNNNSNNSNSNNNNNDDDNDNDLNENTIDTKQIPILLKTIGFNSLNNDEIDEMIEKMIVIVNNEKNQIRDTFNNIDLDQDGFLSSIDIRNTMRKLGISLNNDEIKDMMQAAANATFMDEKANDGRLSRQSNTDQQQQHDWQTNKIDFNQFKAICNIKDTQSSSSSSSKWKRMAKKEKKSYTKHTH
ncbi:uncharacterized protein LOC142645120 [Dermatophagoides pteronyssinus]|uniref:uncharacterized protein LOC142645120 n=1 Tax=Dermatophagoides pteronyssinus TaxID=6956 RepID=UPI003F6818D5